MLEPLSKSKAFKGFKECMGLQVKHEEYLEGNYQSLGTKGKKISNKLAYHITK